MIHSRKRTGLLMQGLLIAALLATGVCAQAEEAEVPASLQEALTGGAPSLDARLRYENATVEGFETSDALTIRTRLGYGTLPYHGVRAYVELEDVSSLVAKDEYNQAGLNNSPTGKTVIADVEGTELNQAFLEMTCPWTDAVVKIGRQRLILGNARFVGNVGWRQNEQTYDAATVVVPEKCGLQLTYGYLDTVYRIFGQGNGNQPPGRAANAARYESDSHVVNLGYRPCSGFASTAYAYLLDLGDEPVGAANSSDTYGVSARISHAADSGLKSVCNLEYARQTDNAASPAGVDYAADYKMAELGGSLGIVGVGAGLEILGSDSGRSFRTPLATGHKFNGWADVFLTAPAQGLQDAYAYASLKCPKGKGPSVKLVYHNFESDVDNIVYGKEYDVVASQKIGKNLSIVAKYANYMADDNPANPRARDVERLSIQAGLAF